MHLLITGGAGYIGSHTTIELLNEGHEITLVDNLCNSNAQVVEKIERLTGKKCDFYKADILDTSVLTAIFKKKPVDAVIHFAALKAVGESTQKPLRYYENNVTGTLRLLLVMKNAGVKRIVFSSSATVYGLPDILPVKEDAQLKSATNPYGASKQMVERILEDTSLPGSDWNISILRYFNPAGAHPSGLLGESPNGIPNNLVPYILQVASGQRKRLGVFGNDYPTPDGTGIRDYIHVCDLARGHVAALEKHKEDIGVHIYNLGAGRGYSVLELVKAFEKATGKKIPFEILQRRPGDIAEIYADTSRANKKLGWRIQHSLEDMMRDAWRWQLESSMNH